MKHSKQCKAEVEQVSKSAHKAQAATSARTRARAMSAMLELRSPDLGLKLARHAQSCKAVQ
eukprot:3342702-Amphidinium_carterae.1